MSSHLNLLTRNIAFFGGISVLGRILNVVGLPLLTWIIADPSVLGRFDLLITIGSLGAAFANLGVNEAAHKVYFDNSDSKFRQEVLTAMVTVGLLATAIIAFLSIVGMWIASDYLKGGVNDVAFPFIVALFIFAFRLRFLFEVPLMVENRKRIVGAVALLEIAVFYISAVFFIKLFTNDYVSLAASRLLSLTFSAILLYFYSLLPWFRWYFPREMVKRLVCLGLPLTFSSVLYWGLSLSDRVVIVTYLGSGALGTYAVCAKFAAISELIRTGVNQGMTFFIFSTSKDEGHERRMYLVTSFFLMISTLLFGMGNLFAPLLVNLFLPTEYNSAAVIIPYLLVGPLLLAAFQIVSSGLILAERPSLITVSQVIGVATTISVSLSVVKILGLRGPALGTLLGYASMFIVALFATRQCGRQTYFKQLCFWTLPLACVIFISLFSNEVIQYLIPLISFGSAGYWAYINRQLCLASTRSVFGLIPR